MMSIEQYFEEGMTQNHSSGGDKSSIDEWRSVSAALPSSDDNSSDCFDCSICLESVQDPVVTLCGHLYCWPCIYKWLQSQSNSSASANQEELMQKCPVCKSEISQATLIPLYGRGQTTVPSKDKASHLGIIIPRRPFGPSGAIDAGRSLGVTSTPSWTRQPHQPHHPNYAFQSQSHQPDLGSYTVASQILGLGGGTTINAFDPLVRMFGEVVCARLFGNSVTTNIYNYPNSYDLVGSSSRRMRRHEIQIDESLSRVSFFLFCCLVFCLLIF